MEDPEERLKLLRIETDEDCNRAEAELHRLLAKPENELSEEENVQIASLSDAIEDYEARTYPDWTC